MKDPLRRVLFISYAYPPTGGGGVQRSVKFTKYLPETRWRPTVLTAANPSVPVQVSDLSGDLDPETVVLRARTLNPLMRSSKNWFRRESPREFPCAAWSGKPACPCCNPIPRCCGIRWAYRMASTALRQTPHEVIYVTGPPFSSFLLGRSLKRRFGLPLVLDFRDEWLLSRPVFGQPPT